MQVTHEIRQEPDGSWLAKAYLRYGKRYADQPREVYFRSTLGPLPPDNADFLVPLTLIPAMVRGENLQIESSISTKLRENVTRVQDILQVFAPCYGQHAERAEMVLDGDKRRTYADGRGVACFFSGGVDSMYTALQHREELSALVFVHGFDIVERDPAHEAVIGGVRRAADAIGLPLIEIETNAKTFADRFVPWDLYSGSALAAVALLLQPHFRKLYIAGARSIAMLFAHGTHPLLDPLWGTESLDIEHDALAERWEKVASLLDSEIAQNHLRVCFENRGGAYNCCECVKCVWVMAILGAYGALDRFKTFEKPLDLDKLARLPFTDPKTRLPVEEMVKALAKQDVNPQVMDAILACIRTWNPTFGLSGNSGLGKWFAKAWPRALD